MNFLNFSRNLVEPSQKGSNGLNELCCIHSPLCMLKLISTIYIPLELGCCFWHLSMLMCIFYHIMVEQLRHHLWSLNYTLQLLGTCGWSSKAPNHKQYIFIVYKLSILMYVHIATWVFEDKWQWLNDGVLFIQTTTAADRLRSCSKKRQYVPIL